MAETGEGRREALTEKERFRTSGVPSGESTATPSNDTTDPDTCFGAMIAASPLPSECPVAWSACAGTSSADAPCLEGGKSQGEVVRSRGGAGMPTEGLPAALQCFLHGGARGQTADEGLRKIAAKRGHEAVDTSRGCRWAEPEGDGLEETKRRGQEAKMRKR